ncbi:MAG TPA: methyltransferase [Candidatus Binatia bacterium]|nr:methyltransferase [Candidatus Binatia bacterium]
MDFSRLMGLATGHVEARIIQTAVELAVFDALEDSGLSSEALAHRLKLEPRAAELLLNALAALDLLHKQGEQFSLAEAARKYLLRSSPFWVGGMIRFEGSVWNCWEKLPQAIRSGQPVRPANMYQDDPRETEIFIEAMDSLVNARGDAEVVARALEWNEIGELLDVGSGPASYPIYLCRKYPELRATIFDLPGTLAITQRYVRAAALMERICLITGDYRKDPIPGSYDMVFLSNIIHGEGEPENLSLIGKLIANLKPGGRLIVKDHILDDSRTTPPVGALFSLLMLLTTASGRCYSFNEIKFWMEQAGLANVEQIKLPPPLTSSLVIGTR